MRSRSEIATPIKISRRRSLSSSSRVLPRLCHVVATPCLFRAAAARRLFRAAAAPRLSSAAAAAPRISRDVGRRPLARCRSAAWEFRALVFIFFSFFWSLFFQSVPVMEAITE
jgi:Na+-driven multidrug efflux pump